MRLRLLEESDLDWVYQLVWHPKVHPWLFWDTNRPLRSGLGATLLEQAPETTSQAYALMGDSGSVGFATLNHMHPVHRTATCAYLAVKPGTPMGAGVQGVRAILDHGFRNLNLNRISNRVFSDNRALIAVMRRLKIKQYGLAPQEFYRDGKWCDMALFAVTKAEWEATNAGR